LCAALISSNQLGTSPPEDLSSHFSPIPFLRDADTPFVFELTVGDRTFFFCAPDEDTLKAWMNAIKRAKSDWWKNEQKKRGKTRERKPAILRGSGSVVYTRNKRINDNAKVLLISSP